MQFFLRLCVSTMIHFICPFLYAIIQWRWQECEKFFSVHWIVIIFSCLFVWNIFFHVQWIIMQTIALFPVPFFPSWIFEQLLPLSENYMIGVVRRLIILMLLARLWTWMNALCRNVWNVRTRREKKKCWRSVVYKLSQQFFYFVCDLPSLKSFISEYYAIMMNKQRHVIRKIN